MLEEDFLMELLVVLVGEEERTESTMGFLEGCLRWVLEKGEREAVVGVEVVERGDMTEEKESERVASGRERGWHWDCGFWVSSEVSWDGRETFGWSESMAREMERGWEGGEGGGLVCALPSCASVRSGFGWWRAETVWFIRSIPSPVFSKRGGANNCYYLQFSPHWNLHFIYHFPQ
jgi:hypothetical protein